MKFLTTDEFEALQSETGVTFQELKTAVEQSEKLVDIYTRRHYSQKNFDTDNPFVKDCVKDAVREQVRYLIRNNVNYLEEINDVPQSLTIGRTTISNASKYSGAVRGATKNIASIGFIDCLSATGLLYRGVE